MRAIATGSSGGRFAAGRAGGFLRGAALACFVSLGGCATAPDRAAHGGADPLEGMNRAVFAFNDGFDRAVLRPVAYVYKEAVPGAIRNAARNFLRWLRSPVILANDLLQGDLERAGATASRFAINGLTAGLADMAEGFGLPHRDEDFGQTMGVHGAGEGAYLVLPLLGPSSLRDAAGLAVDAFIDPVNLLAPGESRLALAAGRRGAEGLDFRAVYYDEVDELRASSLDYYARVRSIYRQQREAAIHNGAPPLDDALPDLSEEFDLPAPEGEEAWDEAAPPDEGTPREEGTVAATAEPEPEAAETAAAPPAAEARERAPAAAEGKAVEEAAVRAEAEAAAPAPAVDARIAAAATEEAEEAEEAEEEARPMAATGKETAANAAGAGTVAAAAVRAGEGAPPAAGPAPARGVHLASYRSRAAAMRGWRVLSGKYPEDLGPYRPEAIRTETGVGLFTRLYTAVGASEPALSRLRDRIRAGGDYAAILAVPADETGGVWR